MKPLKVIEHLVQLAHVHATPFFVLPKATTALGEALGLKRTAALGFKKEEAVAIAASGAKEKEQQPPEEKVEEREIDDVRQRIASFKTFILGKRDFLNLHDLDEKKKKKKVNMGKEEKELATFPKKEASITTIK